MEQKNIFSNLSPLDHRYYLANRELFDRLAAYLSEEASLRYCAAVEGALLRTHMELLGLDPAGAEGLEGSLDPKEVYREEEKTRHNIRALVNVIKKKIPPELGRLVHLGATSADILDTASAMRYRDVCREVLLPLLLEIEESLAGLVEKHAAVPQVGRTHGQHAVPLTLGYALGEFLVRLGESVKRIDTLSRDLRGKLSGAVGAYNALSLIVSDPEGLEKACLAKVGLTPAPHSTQIVEPEYLLRLLLEINIAFGILANLADDLRHLQRTEIGEVREFFSADQVGSSTMPQKRNPWNSEHVKSLWKAFSPRIMTFYMDQISEHQRDLSNSASARFVADYLAGFAAAAARMKDILKGLSVEDQALRNNLKQTGDLVLSEAAYILLSARGESHAHEIIRRLTLKCEHNRTSLAEELTKDQKVFDLVDEQLHKTCGGSAGVFFSRPEHYTGLSVKKARRLAREYRRLIAKLKER
ncbi:MAG: adenylosuccinate lyase [Spirochaetales bacterium]|jgi:adenylosuccinate lyase|nr:adenylosuccinate lyase [Spirochaetales bacterium]